MSKDTSQSPSDSRNPADPNRVEGSTHSGATTTPLYLRIHTKLREKILAGEWSYGAMLPSEYELGEIYGISRGTVRQVLAELEKEKMVSRERGRGTFISYPGLKRSQNHLTSHSISFIVPYVRDSFVSSILLGLEKEARLNNYAVVFSHFENDPEKQEKALRTALSQRVSGIVLYPVDSDTVSPALIELQEASFPLVLVDRYLRSLDTDYVTSDNFNGGLIATQHLLRLGHSQIAFLSWKEGATSFVHRKAGYQQALKEAGIEPNVKWDWEVEGYPEIDQRYLEERLVKAESPSAIFAANDQLAIAVQKAARAVYRHIPEDLAVVGFDDLEISAHLEIPLTTVAQSAFEIGRTAWHLLTRKFVTRSIRTEKHVLPVQLIVRHSCGAMEQIRKEVVKDTVYTESA